MKELYLQFVDTDGDEQSISVDVDEFVIGRHSACDLSIPDSRLSREHIKIQRFAEVLTVADLGSSNGTTLNGEPLEDPEGLDDQDLLNLGGVEISVSFREPGDDDDDESGQEAAPPPSSPQPEAEEKSGLGFALILVSVVGLFLLVGVAVIAFVVISSSESNVASGRNNDDDLYRSTPIERTTDGTETPAPTISSTIAPVGTPLQTPVNEIPPTGQTPVPDQRPTPVASGNRQTETLVYSFMKRIARNDNRPFLKSSHLTEVETRIARFKGSAALAANIRNASANAALIKSTAAEKSLQPQLLAVAAMAKIGNRTGNVTQTAVGMAGVLDKLTIVLSNEWADDALLVIAAYNEGVAGNTLQMRNRVASLTKKNPNSSPREVRTIWFLREKGEISASQYDFALNFLAIGAITQNPKAFGVSSEALKLN
jgi:hypothetical protein